MAKKVLITGGAGFIGINAAEYYLQKGFNVIIFDNFSRKGSRENVEWLQQIHKENLLIIPNDIRMDLSELNMAVEGTDLVLHLAGQVAVTTSVADPFEDFQINALGNLNILEAVRKSKSEPVVIYSSTNKVYGGMEDINVIEVEGKYQYDGLPKGASEERQLDFHSPYGCSKGCADQYVRDYTRIYGIESVVFRQSCIYGFRQFGIEDQGWVAWFTIASALNKPLSIYGDGKQVRDVLFITDLIKAFDMAFENIEKTNGQIYNIGGGQENQMSLHELLALLEKYSGKKIEPRYSNWRPGDKKVFVCDISKAYREFSWKPKIGVEEGVNKLYNWVLANKELFEGL